MNEITKEGSGFVGYEYKEIYAEREKASIYLDGYKNFGWKRDENTPPVGFLGRVSFRLKRDRKILNKTELVRLQRNFDACMNDIEKMESSKTRPASIWALGIGIIGTALLAGAVLLAITSPIFLLLCVTLAVPGFICWVLPYYLYKKLIQRQTKKITPLIDQKYDEIYEICEKGSSLL